MRSQAFTRVSFYAPFYHSYCGEAPFPHTYEEMLKKIKELGFQTPCRNVRIDYRIMTWKKNPDGSLYPIRENRTWEGEEVSAERLLELLACAPPKNFDPVPFQEVERCWNRVFNKA